MGIVGSIEGLTLAVLAGAGMIAADNVVIGALVAADDRMPDRFTGPAHTHFQWQQAQEGVTFLVILNQGLINAHACVMVHIAGFGHPNHRMDQ